MAKNLFEKTNMYFKQAVDIAQLDKEVIQQLQHPATILEVSIPVRMDDGQLDIMKGFRVQHSSIRGPGKGGIRFHPDVHREELEGLAFLMTLKCALMGIPFGGAKGGVVVDAKKLSRFELEKLSRGYIKGIADIIGPNRDIPAPDMYTNEMIMGWMMDEYNAIQREIIPGVITGKPIALGGSQGRSDATGRGGYYVLKSLLKKKNKQPQDMTVAIQGFGNAGQAVARLLHADGFKIVALSDSKGAIYKSEGLDIPSCIQHKTSTNTLKAVYCEGTVCNEVEVEKIASDKLLELDVDILIPAALEDVITKENADNIKADYILELANGPTTPDADSLLYGKGIQVIPDILANAGGVTVSYFEWLQNKTGQYWTLEDVHEKLHHFMQREFEHVYTLVKQKELSLRTAAYVHALNRLSETIMAKGTRGYYRKDEGIF